MTPSEMFTLIRRNDSKDRKPVQTYPGAVGVVMAGEALEVKEWGLGHGPMPRDWETWDDHGFRRELCRYCNGKHRFDDCEAPVGPPGSSPETIQGKWNKHAEALAALRAAAAEEREAE